jgi:hypothetical protein
MSNEVHNLTAKIRDKNIKYRKWKVKDKKKFIKNINDPVLIKESLVFDCIEDKKIGLSDDEYKYMLIKIRESSIPNPIKFTFTCDKCYKDFDYNANLNDIMCTTFKHYTDIVFKDHIFTMGEIQNREFYESAIATVPDNEEKYLVDFILHIKAYNDNNGFEFEEINEVVNNLDVDIFEEIFKKWEDMRFKIDNIHDVECLHCQNEMKFEFDDLPGFFPDSWDLNAKS